MKFFTTLKSRLTNFTSTVRQGISNVTSSIKQTTTSFISNIKSRFTRTSSTEPTTSTPTRPSTNYTYSPYPDTTTPRIQIQQVSDVAMDFFAENGVDFDRELLEAKLDKYPGLMDMIEEAIYYHEYEDALEPYGYISSEDSAQALANLIKGKN